MVFKFVIFLQRLSLTGLHLYQANKEIKILKSEQKHLLEKSIEKEQQNMAEINNLKEKINGLKQYFSLSKENKVIQCDIISNSMVQNNIL